jgi:translation initiation factor 2 beta subunit (eIF-2beta)/eIF-5
MIVKIQTKVNFNFNKVQKRVVTQLISSRLNKIANFALSKVRKTFFTEKDITGKPFAKLSERYKQQFKENPNKRIMEDSGALKSSFKKTSVSKDLSVSIGSPLGDYANHLKETHTGIKRDNGSFKGFKGRYGLIPQRKFFYSSEEEAYEILGEKIEAEIDSFLDDFMKNLSTSMRKLN